MPFKSSKQRKFFKACKSPKFRKKAKEACPSLKTIKKYEKHK